MFCPKCRYEYREGIFNCPDCHVDLVEVLPDMQEEESEFTEYEELLTTYNPADVAMIKSLLDAENITYYFNDEEVMSLRLLVEPARLMIKKDEAEKAREILKDVDLPDLGVNLKEGKEDSGED